MAMAATAVLFAGRALAEEVDPGGTLNPDEMSLNKALSRALQGDVDMVTCAQGYLMTKKGSHAQARRIFEACAARGWTGTMTWMSYMEDNGLGGPEDAKAAARWDRKAALAGDPIGQFNYGLDLLRGRGVARDQTLGRHYIDKAARAGVDAAKRLKEAGYDLDIVTPDADNWKYFNMF